MAVVCVAKRWPLHQDDGSAAAGIVLGPLCPMSVYTGWRCGWLLPCLGCFTGCNAWYLKQWLCIRVLLTMGKEAGQLHGH